jgi:hypothetical protein
MSAPIHTDGRSRLPASSVRATPTFRATQRVQRAVALARTADSQSQARCFVLVFVGRGIVVFVCNLLLLFFGFRYGRHHATLWCRFSFFLVSLLHIRSTTFAHFCHDLLSNVSSSSSSSGRGFVASLIGRRAADRRLTSCGLRIGLRQFFCFL